MEFYELLTIYKKICLNMKNIIKDIINEEIENFDFLNNEKYLKEKENIDLINSEDLQKQFICDSLLNKNTKVKVIQAEGSNVGGNWDTDYPENADTITIDYDIRIQYLYETNTEPLTFDINFYGNNIGVGVDNNSDTGDYHTQPTSETWFYSVNWHDINVSLFTTEGDTIKFPAFEKAPQNIKNLFIREFLADFIADKTSIEVRDNFNKNEITRYC